MCALIGLLFPLVKHGLYNTLVMGNIWNEQLTIVNLSFCLDVSLSVEGFVGNPQLVMLLLLKNLIWFSIINSKIRIDRYILHKTNK